LVGGCQYHKKVFLGPEVQRDTIVLYDTVTHFIRDTVPYYIVKRDTVIVNHHIPAIVDTAAILVDYFAIHYYTRTWQDSTVQITSEDAISENRFIDNRFTYKILRAQTVINNSVNEYTYNRYLYGGLSVPLNDPKSMSIDVIAAFPKLYIGAGYSPGLNSISVKAGVRIFQLRN